MARPDFLVIIQTTGDHGCRIAVAQLHKARRWTADLFQINQPKLQRLNKRIQFNRLRQLLNAVQRDPIRCIKWPRPSPTQFQDMTIAPKLITQIARNRAHIAAFTACHLKHHMIRVKAVNQQQFLNPQITGSQIHLFAIAGLFIRTHTVNFDSGKLWRNLPDFTNKRAERGFDLFVRRTNI